MAKAKSVAVKVAELLSDTEGHALTHAYKAGREAAEREANRTLERAAMYDPRGNVDLVRWSRGAWRAIVRQGMRGPNGERSGEGPTPLDAVRDLAVKLGLEEGGPAHE